AVRRTGAVPVRRPCGRLPAASGRHVLLRRREWRRGEYSGRQVPGTVGQTGRRRVPLACRSESYALPAARPPAPWPRTHLSCRLLHLASVAYCNYTIKSLGRQGAVERGWTAVIGDCWGLLGTAGDCWGLERHHQMKSAAIAESSRLGPQHAVVRYC